MNYKELFAGLSVRLCAESGKPNENTDLTHTECDPCRADDHALYVSAHTLFGNGHDQIDVAYDRGCRFFLTTHSPALPEDAAVFLCEEPEAFFGELAARTAGHPDRLLTVFGVSGSHGKSSALLLAAGLLMAAGRKVGTLTDDGLFAGNRFTPRVLPFAPDSSTVTQALHQMAAAGDEFAFLEFSPYMLAHRSHLGISFSGVAVTDCQPVQLAGGAHRSPSQYREHLFSLIRTGAPFCILPGALDSERPKAGRTLTFGDLCDLSAVSPKSEARNGVLGTAFSLSVERKLYPTFLPHPGTAMLSGALCAVGLALCAGLTPEEIARRLPEVQAPGRLCHFIRHKGADIYLDNAYTPEMLQASLRPLWENVTGRLILLMGAPGCRTRAERSAMGSVAASFADVIYLTSDDPEGEDPKAICEDIESGFPSDAFYHIIPNRKTAIHEAVSALAPGDILLLIGKSQGTTQRIFTRTLPFSDAGEIMKGLSR